MKGSEMVNLIEKIVESLNSRRISSIKSAWTQISEDEGAKAYNMALSTYEEIFLLEFPND